MRTTLFCLLALALTGTRLHAQGVTQQIDQALRADTAPKQRLELIRDIVATDGGAAELVKRGLVSTQTGEVTHAIAEALIAANKHLPHIVPLTRLLLHDAHRVRISRRIAGAGEMAGSREALVNGLSDLALGVDAASSGNAEMRIAAVRALAVISWRPALEALVKAWSKEKDAAASDACREAVMAVIGAETAPEAVRYLASRPYATYTDLLRELTRRLTKELAKMNRYRKLALEQADAETALAVFSNGNDREGTRIAAARLQQLAADKQWGKLTPDAFAKRMFEIFVDQRDRAQKDPAVLASLASALGELWRGDDKAPLRQVANAKTFVDAILPLATAGTVLKDAGRACVTLLGDVGDTATAALVEFAREFGDSEVREAAIQKLGGLAATSEKSSDFIGRSLADMLATGAPDPRVRSKLLFTLARTRSFSGAALERLPVRGWLVDPKNAPKLTAQDLRYCVILVTKSGGDASLEALIKVSKDHPDTSVRLLAATEGLLRWMQRDAKVAPRLRAHIQQLVLASDQPEALRVKLLEALGELSGREMNVTLLAIESAADAPAAVRAGARKARFELANRLTTVTGGSVAREDLEVALKILATLKDDKQREQIAEKIVYAADSAKLPAGNARYMLALMKAATQDEATVTRLLAEAAVRAEADGLDVASHRDLRNNLRDRAVTGGRHKEAVEHSLVLAKLTTDKREIAKHFTEAAEFALKASDKARAREFAKSARGTGTASDEIMKRLVAVEKLLGSESGS